MQQNGHNTINIITTVRTESVTFLPVTVTYSQVRVTFCRALNVDSVCNFMFIGVPLISLCYHLSLTPRMHCHDVSCCAMQSAILIWL